MACRCESLIVKGSGWRCGCGNIIERLTAAEREVIEAALLIGTSGIKNIPGAPEWAMTDLRRACDALRAERYPNPRYDVHHGATCSGVILNGREVAVCSNPAYAIRIAEMLNAQEKQP